MEERARVAVISYWHGVFHRTKMALANVRVVYSAPMKLGSILNTVNPNCKPKHKIISIPCETDVTDRSTQ